MEVYKMRLSEKQVDNWFNTCEVRYARNRLLEIRDRLGYTFKKEVTKIFRENIEDENVQFFIKVMYECMFVVTNLSELREKIDIGFEENNEVIIALQNEIAQLRTDLLDAQKQIREGRAKLLS